MTLEEVDAGLLVQMNAAVARRRIDLCDAAAAAGLRSTNSAILMSYFRPCPFPGLLKLEKVDAEAQRLSPSRAPAKGPLSETEN